MTSHDFVKRALRRLYRKRDGIGQTPCSYGRYLVIIILFFFANEVYRTNMTHIEVWTPSGPKHIDPLFKVTDPFLTQKTENLKSI